MKIIFLDVDGVLNDLSWSKQQIERIKQQKTHERCEINPACVARLARIVRRTGAKIVLSSTWRHLKDSDDAEIKRMWQYLVDSLAQQDMTILDCTPVLPGNRPEEIASWLLYRKAEVETFVILDDDFTAKDYEPYGLDKHLVKTEYFSLDGGLQERHVDQAIAILEGGLS